MIPQVFLIVGLGNPGAEYEDTRHNIGFLVVQDLSRRFSARFTKSSHLHGKVAEVLIDGREVNLFMPMTFVNNSGLAVKAAVAKKKVDLPHILVIMDDLNLSFGQLRLRPSGSDGGHHGLSSIIQHLGTNQFARLRLGIGAPSVKAQTVDYVLSEFTDEEKRRLDDFIREAGECCLGWLDHGVHWAMNLFNRRGKDE